MPLMTELTDRAGRLRAIPWSWEDRMILTDFVLLDGGQVGEMVGPNDPADLRGFGYVGAGCDHEFKNEFGYSQVDTKKTIRIKPGQRYREYRG